MKSLVVFLFVILCFSPLAQAKSRLYEFSFQGSYFGLGSRHFEILIELPEHSPAVLRGFNICDSDGAGGPCNVDQMGWGTVQNFTGANGIYEIDLYGDWRFQLKVAAKTVWVNGVVVGKTYHVQATEIDIPKYLAQVQSDILDPASQYKNLTNRIYVHAADEKNPLVGFIANEIAPSNSIEFEK